MRGSPRDGRPEHRPISTTPKARQEAPKRESVSTSRNVSAPGAHSAPKPKVLIGEVAAPIPKYAASGGGSQEIVRRRETFRAFMVARHLRPSEWAKAAGIAPGEVMAFLTGHARTISPQSLEKLAQAAKASVDDFFG